ncbi:MAG: stage IV sporulation protein A [Clostridia bacterium]|nr:stage IV sporulation protein A [Clostridia bacterium]
MSEKNIYTSIATRTQGDIYIGVVGPVRTGKSTFIKRFMDVLVLPNISSESKRVRAVDELPQSSSGRTIMTTEPKFIPEDAVEITIDSVAKCNIRLIDCVGYIVPSSLGYIENDMPRMVKTPWFEKDVPFNMAAEIGTQKVITEHSTIGLVITTDGSIGDIPREEYEEAEERVINELKEIKKPFVILLNCRTPNSPESIKTAEKLSNKYGVGVLPINCMELTEKEIESILSLLLYEFPLKEIRVCIAPWITQLEKEHWLRKEIFSTVYNSAEKLKRVKDIYNFTDSMNKLDNVSHSEIKQIDLAEGMVTIKVDVKSNLFYKILSERTCLSIKSDKELFETILMLTNIKKEFDRLKSALDEVEKTGYGIVMPTMAELTLEEPEIMKQGGRYGVRLKASAPSIHMMKADITTEVAPIVGTESQSEELIMYLLKEFEEDPSKIWESNIFGKSLNSLVNEGLHNKLYKMPSDARMKLQETLERIINEGCSGLICIII